MLCPGHSGCLGLLGGLLFFSIAAKSCKGGLQLFVLLVLPVAFWKCIFRFVQVRGFSLLRFGDARCQRELSFGVGEESIVSHVPS